MKPIVFIAAIIVLTVAADLYFDHGRSLHAIERGLSHLWHKRLIE